MVCACVAPMIMLLLCSTPPGVRVGVVVQPMRVVLRPSFLLGLAALGQGPPVEDSPSRWVLDAVNRLRSDRAQLAAKVAMAGVAQPPEVHVQVWLGCGCWGCESWCAVF